MRTLDGVKMTVFETSENGIVNEDTIFRFSQVDDVVTAKYSGGKIIQGFLVGKINGANLEFSYCQMQLDGVLDCGLSFCQLSIDKNGKFLLKENFEWKTRPGEFGINIFQEI